MSHAESIQHSPLFNRIWEAIKGWDIERKPGDGYHGLNGTDVQTIIDAVEAGHERGQILDLLQKISENSLDTPLLELIGSCFAAGDISHIGDEELAENLRALIEVEKEHPSKSS